MTEDSSIGCLEIWDAADADPPLEKHAGPRRKMEGEQHVHRMTRQLAVLGVAAISIFIGSGFGCDSVGDSASVGGSAKIDDVCSTPLDCEAKNATCMDIGLGDGQRRCVKADCVSDGDCGEQAICQLTNGVCARTCTTDGDCPSSALVCSEISPPSGGVLHVCSRPKPPPTSCTGQCNCTCSGGHLLTGLIGGACSCDDACRRTGNGASGQGSCY